MTLEAKKSQLAHRAWVPNSIEDSIQQRVAEIASKSSAQLLGDIAALVSENRQIHEQDCFNLNPATNAMNPKAEALLASGLGSRPSLGYPGDKYEMGLEAIEQIEVLTAALCAEVFEADFAEIRVGSGALANLYGFMATCKAGDTIIVPPASIGGHVTHHIAGCAGLFGLNIIEAPTDPQSYTVDVAGLSELAKQTKPKLITVGGSLNLFEHPVAEVRTIADTVGAKVMFDAAHQCGMIAGKVWKNPLAEGAHFMTMSTYKSLGGPAGGLIVSNDAEIAEALDAIAFPGLTANFDVAKSAALAVTMLDWRDFGADYAKQMQDVSLNLAQALQRLGLPVFTLGQGATQSHQFALEAATYGGGQAASKLLRQSGFLACGIGLPIEAVAGDMNGLRMGTPELVRWGMQVSDTPKLADLIAQALAGGHVSAPVAEWRKTFDQLHYVHS